VSSQETEIEERLSRSLHIYASGIPDHPPTPWASAQGDAGCARSRAHHHLYGALGLAASVVLVVIATLLWASPSAGARYDEGGHRSVTITAAPDLTGVPQSLAHVAPGSPWKAQQR
jgi:hypothetical protein